MDLARRFASACASAGLRVLALKGISLADELYGGVHNRPMADIDFLVVDTSRFTAAAGLARELGLVEVGASDHALVFREPASGAILELHVSLTACPGLFPIDHQALWEERAPVPGSSMDRLGDRDLVVHLALHTAFQHALAANDAHYEDFVRVLEGCKPSIEGVIARAREWGALPTLALMAAASSRRRPESRPLADLCHRLPGACPPGLARWLESLTEFPPSAQVGSMALVRYRLAPSKWSYLLQTLLPQPIPGRTLPRPAAFRRLRSLIEAAFIPSHRPTAGEAGRPL